MFRIPTVEELGYSLKYLHALPHGNAKYELRNRNGNPIKIIKGKYKEVELAALLEIRLIIAERDRRANNTIRGTSPVQPSEQEHVPVPQT